MVLLYVNGCVFTAHGSINFFNRTLIKFNPFHCIQNNNNNFIDFIFDVKISVPEQSIQWQMKQSKIKVKKESNNNTDTR